MEEDGISVPCVEGRNDDRGTIVDDPQMAQISLVENRIDRLAVIRPTLGKPLDGAAG